jgi:hypothetical protein
MGAAQGSAKSAEAPPWPRELDQAMLALSQVFQWTASVLVRARERAWCVRA